MDKELKQSYYNIRTSVGVLGILLPILLYLVNGEMLQSISINYYSKASFIFSAIIFSFSLFLITYKGYEKDETEKISDNVLTNIAGVMALFVIVFPTSYESILNCPSWIQGHYIFNCGSKFISTIHFISSGSFFILMGGMSFFKFSRGKNTKFKYIYKFLGVIMWISIILIGINMQIFDNKEIFIYETIILWAFGISLLLKCKFLFKL
jgi:hypothetical protein